MERGMYKAQCISLTRFITQPLIRNLAYSHVRAYDARGGWRAVRSRTRAQTGEGASQSIEQHSLHEPYNARYKVEGCRRLLCMRLRGRTAAVLRVRAGGLHLMHRCSERHRACTKTRPCECLTLLFIKQHHTYTLSSMYSFSVCIHV
jgi:hypothetical protein